VADWQAWGSEIVRAEIAEAVALAGGIRAAARASGVDEATLRRLLPGQTDRPLRFAEQTAKRLLKWLPRDARDTLEICCNRREIRTLGHEEQIRLLTVLGAAGHGTALEFLGAPTTRARARESLYERLKEQREIELLFNGFENDLKRRNLSVSSKGLRLMEPRAQLAYERVLGPLLDGVAAGAMELTTDELAEHKVRQKLAGKDNPRRKGGTKRPSRLYRFLDLGMKRELILLDDGRWEDRIVQKAAKQTEREIRVKMLEIWLEDSVKSKARSTSGRRVARSGAGRKRSCSKSLPLV
jgi:hypothetical protein